MTCFLYLYIKGQNQITDLQIKLPILKKEIDVLIEINTALNFREAQFKNSSQLLYKLKQAEFSHLFFEEEKNVIHLDECEINHAQ